MKKGYFIKFVLLILILILIGCSKEIRIPVGTYTMNESTESIKPTVLLELDNKFTFNYSTLSSYYAIGSYEKSKNRLILKTDDGNFEYVFEIHDYTLIFNDSESSEMPLTSNVPGGALFRFNHDKTK